MREETQLFAFLIALSDYSVRFVPRILENNVFHFCLPN